MREVIWLSPLPPPCSPAAAITSNHGLQCLLQLADRRSPPCCQTQASKNSRWMHLGAAKVGTRQKIQPCWAHHPVSNPSFSASFVCALVPCALHIPLLADCCVHPPSCLLLPPSQARPFVAICPSRCHLSPSQQVATSCCAVAVTSDSKVPLIHPG